MPRCPAWRPPGIKSTAHTTERTQHGRQKRERIQGLHPQAQLESQRHGPGDGRPAGARAGGAVPERGRVHLRRRSKQRDQRPVPGGVPAVPGRGQPLHAPAPEHRRPGQQGADAALLRHADRLLLSALRRSRCRQRRLQHHLRVRPQTRHELPRPLQGVLELGPARGPGGRRRHDGPQGRPRQAPGGAGRPGPLSAGQGASAGGDRRLRRQAPPDRRAQLARDPGHADPHHAPRRGSLGGLLRRADRHPRGSLRLRPPDQRHPQTGSNQNWTWATRSSAARR